MGHHLAQPQPSHDPPHAVPQLRGIRAVGRQRRPRQTAWNQCVAVSPGDLLRDVDGLHYVEPMRRNRDLPGSGLIGFGHLELQGSQELPDPSHIQRDAEQALGAGHVAADHAASLWLRVVVDDAARHPSAADLGYQLRGTIRRVAGHVPADPLLMPHARLGSEAQLPRRISDGRPVKDG